MDKQIIKIANKELKKLLNKYDGLINVVLDDWRGFRFVFDSKDVRNCKNECQKCKLFIAVNKNKAGIFNPGLFLASDEDKKIFGPQNFLNCKTLQQYRDCYVNFLVCEAIGEDQIKNELDLIKNSMLIYSKKGELEKEEEKFKKSILKAALKKAESRKKAIILKYLTSKFDYKKS